MLKDEPSALLSVSPTVPKRQAKQEVSDTHKSQQLLTAFYLGPDFFDKGAQCNRSYSNMRTR